MLSGIALSPELQDRYGRHSKNCDPVSVLRVRTSRLFGEPSSSGFPRVRSTCTVLLHTLCWHLTAVQLAPYCPVPVAGTITAKWLSSPGGSPRPPHPLMRFTLRSQTSHYVTLCHGIALPLWPMLKFEASPITGDSASPTCLPLEPFGFGV